MFNAGRRLPRPHWLLACVLAQALAVPTRVAVAATPPALSPQGDATAAPAKDETAKKPGAVAVSLKADANKKAEAPVAPSAEGHVRKKDDRSQGQKGEAATAPARADKAGSSDKAGSAAKTGSAETAGPADKAGSSEKAGTADKAGSSEKAGTADKAGSSEKAEPATRVMPPIKMSALRDEMSRPHREEHSPARAEREKLEQLAGEVNKAREGLRQDTARLEALVATRDAPPLTANGGEGGDAPVKKAPLPLDLLAKAMRGMKPEQAAPIISRVSRKLAADVLLRMPATDAGKVLGVCKPDVAAELAAEIASRSPHAELKR